ncbi:MAG: ABC transporter permease [Victivallales bacterium]|nr:ABC transporter permease [Victivallales bacterium]
MPLRRKTSTKPVHVAVVTDTHMPGHTTLRMEGCWKKDNSLPQASQVDIPQDATHLTFVCDGITEWDSGWVAFLNNLLNIAHKRNIDVNLDGLPEGPRRLLRLAQAVPVKETDISHEDSGWLHCIGKKAIGIINTTLAINRFIGELTIALLKFCVGIARARWFNVWDQISKAGYQALPLISMIGYLIGLILAFIGSIPLKMFGADIFVASLVGIGVLRLMSPVMVGTVMAGRTGASFAAELGSMNVNDEIDAFQAMGVSPMEFLVLPRFLALCVMVPLLCLYSDLLGILGGMTVGLFYSNLTYLEFYKQMTSTTTINDLLVGVFTSFVFGILISICGCYQGIRCGRNSTAVGQAATTAVVSSMVCMTIASAIITVLTVILKI